MSSIQHLLTNLSTVELANWIVVPLLLILLLLYSLR